MSPPIWPTFPSNIAPLTCTDLPFPFLLPAGWCQDRIEDNNVLGDKRLPDSVAGLLRLGEPLTHNSKMTWMQVMCQCYATWGPVVGRGICTVIVSRLDSMAYEKLGLRVYRSRVARAQFLPKTIRCVPVCQFRGGHKSRCRCSGR
jgi:hypothetical protein